MVDPADVDTIEEILLDYGLDDILEPKLYNDLLARLQDRELTMVSDSARTTVREGLDRIIKEY